MRLFGYPYNNDLVICKDSSDYLAKCQTVATLAPSYHSDLGKQFWKVAHNSDFEFINVQYRSASLSINPASRAGACTDCEYIECTIAIIIIVILV